MIFKDLAKTLPIVSSHKLYRFVIKEELPDGKIYCYGIGVYMTGKLKDDGRVINFSQVDKVMNDFIKSFTSNPKIVNDLTTESVALCFFERLAEEFDEVEKVRVTEDDYEQIYSEVRLPIGEDDEEDEETVCEDCAKRGAVECTCGYEKLTMDELDKILETTEPVSVPVMSEPTILDEKKD